ncbi:hypothetical protein FHL15_001916 [Xylaria flabelliformis]|uniref:Receptor L-domain domain-containing protein n=1 Tax=Xylaria flabelliformis TaxID=2512241 RepID=A0A553IAA1_9PEZI|nr:hypothetical protein FHL15_001916 [Xylaria flabelliformis]
MDFNDLRPRHVGAELGDRKPDLELMSIFYIHAHKRMQTRPSPGQATAQKLYSKGGPVVKLEKLHDRDSRGIDEYRSSAIDCKELCKDNTRSIRAWSDRIACDLDTGLVDLDIVERRPGAAMESDAMELCAVIAVVESTTAQYKGPDPVTISLNPPFAGFILTPPCQLDLPPKHISRIPKRFGFSCPRPDLPPHPSRTYTERSSYIFHFGFILKMYSKELVSAVVALGMVSGATALGCKDDPVQVNSQADATQASNCDSIANDVVFGVNAGTEIDLGGRLKVINGSLIIKNNGAIQTLQSSSLTTIGGDFIMQNVTSLVSLVMPALGEVGTIQWTTLNAFTEPTFGNPGITKAKSVTVADTFVQNLDGINVQAVTDMNINNNHRLSKFSTSIKTLSNALYVNSNALNMTMEMPNLEWIANMTIANVSTFSVPSLKTVNGSMRFDSNYFTNFFAPNLTETHDGDLSFVSNPQLQNISIPLLKKVGGGLTIANNTDLMKVDGLGSLTDVGGAIKMRGSFDEIDLPDLNNVVGTAEFVSTEDITDSCNALNKLSGNVIQGKVTDCRGSDASANNDTSSAGDGSSGSGSSGSSGNKNAASLSSASMSTVVTLAALGGLVAAFL